MLALTKPHIPILAKTVFFDVFVVARNLDIARDRLQSRPACFAGLFLQFRSLDVLCFLSFFI